MALGVEEMGSEGVAVASVIAEGRMALEGSVMEVGLASAETMEELAGSQAAAAKEEHP